MENNKIKMVNYRAAIANAKKYPVLLILVFKLKNYEKSMFDLKQFKK